jgi:general stress protein 26
MNELEERIWKILGRKQTAALATVTDANTPWVRYVTVESDQNFTLRFCTSRCSRKAKQIADNHRVHLICGMLQPPDDSVFLQIAGHAEICTEAATKATYWLDEWRRYFKGPDDPDYVIIFVHPTSIEYTGPGSYEPEVWKATGVR